jgi:tetratricopeptide (TPR) repeat protein
LKLAAGLLGVRLDDLIHREARRRGRDQAMVTAIASSVAFVTSGLAYFAAVQAEEAQKQRAIAVTERDMATSALDYLVGIFRIANPATENPKTITALTVLDRGRQRIESSFGDKPAVQGKLLGAIGEIYANLGEIDMARKTLTAAIEKPGGAIEDRLNAELRLAEVLTKAVQLDEAKDILNQVDREIADKVGVVDDLNSVRGRIAERRAEIAIYGARDDEAVKFFEEAKRHFSAASSDDARLFVARASSSRGLILSRMKRFDEAREDLEFARLVQLELHGAGHLETAAATQNLAYMNFEAGENEKAAKLLNEAISTYRRVIEPTHPVYSQAILLLGRIYEAQGDFAAAVKAHRESVKTAQSVYGANNENVGYRLLYLALAEAKAGDAADGLASLDAAQEIYDLKFPAGDFNHGDIRVYRAMVLDKAGRPEEAKRLCAEGLDMLKANLPANDVYLGEMTGHCAAISG